MKVITVNEKYDLYNPEDAARGILRKQKIEPANNEKSNASALFLREWAKRPIQVAAIAPSSTHLAKLMAAEISADTGPVIEMGPGTGVFTQQLLANGVPPQNLYLIEKNESFANLLKTRFPNLQVVNGDAAKFTQESLGADRPFGAAVSGMGVLSMPREVVKNILLNCFNNMNANGAFYQFTYFWRCPIPKSLLDELGLKAERTGYTMRNIPPACVYKISRKA